MRLEGRTAIVTGAAQGIGAHIAEGLAREGARVGVADIRATHPVVDAIHAAGGTAVGIHLDVTSEDCVADAFDRLADQWGPVDILVNNAALGTPVALVRDLELAAWERTLRVNLTGAMLCTRAALRQMTGRPGGTVINIASNVAKRGLPHRSAYVASKWALLGLTQTLALEVASEGIRVNAVCPGPVETPHLDEVMRGHAEAEGTTVADIAEQWRTGAPIGRFIEAREVVDVCLFLASGASSALTGEAINVSGGLVMS
ncbi:SDR family NAD(P)-dependent oxidoreductase [Geodermatophilus ruber]|uniref:NAD(P)-dependent dehydrogenase, short-chain alcohol dehydrogenase family n=1 Tax=Geodermatophilus ruber TaxID=504800 RepID=A0A1I4G498_9ACTN|nr:SDR family NAD(P)-dependent oxidoreductase [Geodermatophilus ruber]SFL24885.1 NAD(P)-dependent dehydrogenase, short-chain alcohol dehydrogenase family [Geodermatophilus ruber]